MRRFMPGLIVLLIASSAYAQLSVPGLIPTVIPTIFSSTSNSVIDHNGNLIVFDVSYSYTTATNQSTVVRVAPTVKTHVTVITVTANGANKTFFDYDGALQVVGVGRQAVYAIINTYTSLPVPMTVPMPPVSAAGGGGAAGGSVTVFPVPIATTVNRRLVALNAIAGTLPATLPSIDTLGGADVKVSPPGADPALDTIALIDSTLSPPIALGGTLGSAASTNSHSVRLFTFNGGTFKAVNATAIVVP